MKHVYLWTALAIIALVMAIALWRMGPPHYPKVAAELPGNVTLTFIEQPKGSQKSCEHQIEVVSAKIRGKCPNCRITASCPTSLNSTETRALQGQAINLPVVHTTASIVIINAQATAAMAICASMSEQISKLKIQQASCLAPAVR